MKEITGRTSAEQRGVALAAEVAELGMDEVDRSRFRAAALRAIQRRLGFDLGAIQSEVAKAVDSLDGTPFIPSDLRPWLSEFGPDELRYFATRETRDVLEGISSARLDQLAIGRELIRPLHVTGCLTNLWLYRGGAVSLVLARTGRSRAFSEDERRIIDIVAPVVATADGQLSTQLCRHDEDAVGHLSLTASEARVGQLASRGLTNAEVATVLGISPHTVRNHLVSVFRKLDVSTRAELAFFWSAPHPRHVSDAPAHTGRSSTLTEVLNRLAGRCTRPPTR